MVPSNGRFVPAAQGWHKAALKVGPSVPTAHKRHADSDVLPMLGLKVPCGQLEHQDAPSVLYVPAGQIEHTALPSLGLNVPAAH